MAPRNILLHIMHYWIAIGLFALPALSFSAEPEATASASETVAHNPEPSTRSRKVEPRKISSAFSTSGSFWTRLREQRAMPILHLIQSHERELFIGVDADGTVGFRYSFGR